MRVNVRYDLHFIIWDLVEHLGSPEISFYVLSNNIESRLEWLLASACILHFY